MAHREHWRGIQEGLRVGFARVPAEGFAIAHLDQLAPVHDSDVGGEITHQRHGVGYEEIGQLEALLQLPQQVDDLRADAHVESGNGFVEYQKLRLERESAGDVDPLPLTTGKLVRIALKGRFVQANGCEERAGIPPRSILVRVVDFEWLLRRSGRQSCAGSEPRRDLERQAGCGGAVCAARMEKRG